MRKKKKGRRGPRRSPAVKKNPDVPARPNDREAGPMPAKPPQPPDGVAPTPAKPPVPPRGRTTRRTPEWYWLAAFVVLMLLAVCLAVLLPRQTPVQQYFFRILFGISVAGLASIIPGFIELEMRWARNTVRAGGAIAVFVLLFLVNPPKIETGEVVEIELDGAWEFYIVLSKGEELGGRALIQHTKGSNVFVITGNIPARPGAPPDFKPTLVTFESNFGVITSQRVIFHYRNNANEEGIAVADYTRSGKRPDELLFNFHDYADTDRDGIASGLLKFKRIK